jgi:hypothetical protein
MGTGAARAGTGLRVYARDPVRALVLAVIVLGHAVLIHFMAQHISVPRILEADGFSAVPIHLMQIVEPEQAPPRRNRRENRPVASLAPLIDPVDEDNSPESREIATPPMQSATVVPGVRMDWTGEAANADQQIAQARRKGFGEAPQDSMPAEKKPLGVFERGPPHRAGDIELFEDGVERRWISSRCYLDFGGPPDPLARRKPRVNPVQCMLGSSEPDGDLFDHLKPRYLKGKQ